MRKPLYSRKGLTDKQLEIRDIAMADLKAFVSLVAPQRMLGHCHHDMLDFLQYGESEYKLVLWPRAHQKSAMIGYKTAWEVIKNPATTILYASDSLRLAASQLYFIKNILTSDIVKKYWPDLIKDDEGKREMWRQDAIAVDHWYRKDQIVRDPTIMAVGIGAGITGAHFDHLKLDDVVVYENSYTEEERKKCQTWYSLANSILNPGGTVEAVGTRYHPKDLYNDLMEMQEEIFSEDGEVVETRKMFEVSQRVVEEDGNFLWPRQMRKDGQWFGFNFTELAKKRSNYLDKTQFYAQYYNDPSDPDNQLIESFSYYNKENLNKSLEGWYYGDKKLNVYAAIDFASTVTKKSDYTCIVVVGVDREHNTYILDIDRFKSDKISEMHRRLTSLYNKWHWIKLRGEATAAQNLVVNQLKEMNRNQGIFYSVEIFKPTTDKETRIRTNLEPRYAEGVIHHYRGGNCELLEEELQSQRPAHDDIKDALASVMEITVAPSLRSGVKKVVNLATHPKFGGIA